MSTTSTQENKSGQIEYGLGEGVVLQLTEKIQGLFCQLYMDNFLNSPLLQWKLSQQNILNAGTVRANRKHLPKAPQVPCDKSMKRGDVVAFEANNIHYIKWMDNKPVQMLSNFLSVHSLHNVKRRKDPAQVR